MTKGHNKGSDKKETNRSGENTQGQDQHLKHSKRDDDPKGRNANEDQSGGTKGQNAI